MLEKNVLDNLKKGFDHISLAEKLEPVWFIRPKKGSKRFWSVVNEYESALESFSKVFYRYPMHTTAVESFAYCIAKLKYYYNKSGLGGIGVLVNLKYGPYLGKEHAEILKEYYKLQEFIKEKNMKLFPSE